MPYDENKLSELETQDEALSKEVSIEEKKAIIKEAKRRYGKDWMRVLRGFGSGGSGLNWSALKFNLR